MNDSDAHLFKNKIISTQANVQENCSQLCTNKQTHTVNNTVSQSNIHVHTVNHFIENSEYTQGSVPEIVELSQNFYCKQHSTLLSPDDKLNLINKLEHREKEVKNISEGKNERIFSDINSILSIVRQSPHKALILSFLTYAFYLLSDFLFSTFIFCGIYMLYCFCVGESFESVQSDIFPRGPTYPTFVHKVSNFFQGMPTDTKNLAKSDTVFRRRGSIIDLTTQNEGKPVNVNFLVKIKIQDLPSTIAELDSDSHLSLISEEYFNKNLKHVINSDNVLYNEPKTVFKGMGGGRLQSPIHPLQLTFQIGGAILSGRFVVTQALRTSDILLGSNIFYKYKFSLIAKENFDEYVLSIGQPVVASVPVSVTVQKVQVLINKSEAEFIIEKPESLHDELQPGLEVFGKQKNIEEELLHIRNSKSIPERFKDDIIDHLRKIPDLFCGSNYGFQSFPTSEFVHEIDFIDPSIKSLSAKPYPAAGIRLEQLKAALDKLEQEGVIKKGDSPFVSPAFFVLKKPGEGKTASTGRLVFDYRRLNSLILPMNFPIQRTQNVLDTAAKYSLFAIIDVRDAFSTIALSPDAQKKAAIITACGVYTPLRTPFGLKTSPPAFLYCLDKALGHLKYVIFYMDDCIVCGNSEEELCENIKAVFTALHKYNFKLQLDKMKLFKREVKILGLIFSKNNRKIDPSRIKAILDIPIPTTVKETQRLLGCLAFLSSFIPHYSTRLFPVFALLKGASQGQKFEMTQEAIDAITEIKEFLAVQTQLYNIDFSKPLYLNTDASQVALGAFLYQLDILERTEENKQRVLMEYGFLPDSLTDSRFLIPGVSPGKNTPIVTTFANSAEEYKKYDISACLDRDVTMTEKLKKLENFIVIVKPIAFYSKTFSESQQKGYSSLEKEFQSLMVSVQYFRDYIQSCPITYILTDSMPILWAMRHKDDSLQLTRALLKLWEYPFNIVLVHLAGSKNRIADFLSRTAVVGVFREDNSPKGKAVIRKGIHISSNVPLLSVLNKKDIELAFENANFEPCEERDPERCRKNVNSALYRGLGPFEYTPTVVKKLTECRNAKITRAMEDFSITLNELNEMLTQEKLFKAQRGDQHILSLISRIERKVDLPYFYLKDEIVWRTFGKEKHPHNIVVPTKLVPVILTKYHILSHAGARKMFLNIRKKFWWPHMIKDIKSFTAGCILCSINKSDTAGPGQFGEPLKASKPCQVWQIDVLSGIPSVKGYDRILNMVDLFSGYSVPVALRNDMSSTVAEAIETNIIKIFGVPEKISSDNAPNLSGPEVRRLLKFYNIKHALTTPYRPLSHSNVEISNRYITQLLRILTEQFSCDWLNVLPISTVMINNVPRNGLAGFSPFFMMFGRENNENPELSTSDENENLDLNKYLLENKNNHNFAKLLYEYLLCKRKQARDLNTAKILSIPRGTLVYSKDFSQRPHKKMRPIYLRTPEKVIREYQSIVYTVDFFGKIKRRGKSDVKIASPRTIHLFERLPKNIRLLLGEPLDAKSWEKLKSKGELPDYLHSIHTDIIEPMRLRSNLPADNLTLSAEIRDDSQLTELDMTLIEDEDDYLSKLRFLHNENLLIKDNMAITDVRSLYKKHSGEKILNVDVPQKQKQEIREKSPSVVPVKNQHSKTPPPNDNYTMRNRNKHIDPANIIDGPRKRTVRFASPLVMQKEG